VASSIVASSGRLETKLALEARCDAGDPGERRRRPATGIRISAPPLSYVDVCPPQRTRLGEWRAFTPSLHAVGPVRFRNAGRRCSPASQLGCGRVAADHHVHGADRRAASQDRAADVGIERVAHQNSSRLSISGSSRSAWRSAGTCDGRAKKSSRPAVSGGRGRVGSRHSRRRRSRLRLRSCSRPADERNRCPDER